MLYSLQVMLRRLLLHPLVRPMARSTDVEGEAAFEVHRRLIASKPLLRHVYSRWYRECLPAYEATRGMEGFAVEVGSGAGFLEEWIPGLVKTDCLENSYIHRVCDAMALDFPPASLKNLFGISVLHHFPRPEKFFDGALRSLKPGGRLVLVEPNNCFLEKLLCRWLHHYEYYDDRIPDWNNEVRGRLCHANLALPWVIFVRDRRRFEKEYPGLEILNIRYHTFLSYYVSGGMSFRQFFPSKGIPLVDGLERLAAPFMKRLGTMMTIDLRRR